MNTEEELAAALRRQDPGPDFTKAVMARVATPVARARPASRRRLPLALAASVLLAVCGSLVVEHQMQQQRLADMSEQLNLALAITSVQLNYVRQKISRNDQVEDGI